MVVGWWRFLSEPAPLRSAVWKGGVLLGILLALHGPPAFEGRGLGGRVAARKKARGRRARGGGVEGGREKKTKNTTYGWVPARSNLSQRTEPEPDLNQNLNHGRRTGLIEGDGRGAAVRECDLAGRKLRFGFWQHLLDLVFCLATVPGGLCCVYGSRFAGYAAVWVGWLATYVVAAVGHWL